MNILNGIALVIGYTLMVIGGFWLAADIALRIIYALGDKRNLVRWARKGRDLERKR